MPAAKTPEGSGSARMTIAMVSMSASPLSPQGGVDTQQRAADVGALSRALAARGHEVVVHTRRDSRSQPSHVRLAPGVTVHHVGAGPLRPMEADDLEPYIPRFASELTRRWSQQPPHVAHAHFWDSGVTAAQAAAATGIPVALSMHEPSAPEPVRRHAARDPSPRLGAERALARGTHLVFAASDDEARELLRMGTPSERLVVVPPGVDTSWFRPDGPEASRTSRHHQVLSLGPLTPEGGVDDAIRMIAQVSTATLVVAGGPPPMALGSDPDVARLRHLAQALEVDDRVRFSGEVAGADLPALVRSADVVVCLPWYDRSGRVAVLSMACGRPIVAAATGALLDVVDDGVTGLLVAPQSPSAAALAVRRLLGAPGLRDDMGVHARARAEGQLDWRHVADAVESGYRTLSSGRAATVPLPRPPHVPADPRAGAQASGVGVCRGS